MDIPVLPLLAAEEGVGAHDVGLCELRYGICHRGQAARSDRRYRDSCLVVEPQMPKGDDLPGGK